MTRRSTKRSKRKRKRRRLSSERIARWRRIQPHIQMPDSFTEFRYGHCHPFSCRPSYGSGKLVKQFQEWSNLNETGGHTDRQICPAWRPIKGWRYATWHGERMHLNREITSPSSRNIWHCFSVKRTSYGWWRTKEMNCGIISIMPAWPRCKHGGKRKLWVH